MKRLKIRTREIHEDPLHGLAYLQRNTDIRWWGINSFSEKLRFVFWKLSKLRVFTFIYF